MSNGFDDGYDVAAVRGVGHDQPAHWGDDHVTAHAASAIAAPTPGSTREAVKISLSPEAKAVLETIERDRAVEQARRGAKEIAAAAGVSEAKAVAAAQPTRSPPPAKGAALFQANLPDSDKTSDA